ncbi:UNVERIFIED_CONTAM: 3-oxoacyl-[acyl-carrier-protein] synthase-3 [Acetivibrio alkalicellulosi]
MREFYFPKNKKKTIKRFCKILSSASFLPERVLTNDDIINDGNLPFRSSVIEKSIGVYKRHIANKSWDDSDILVASAKKCLDGYCLDPERLSRIIVNKYFGDNLLPMTASRLQNKLGSSMAVHAFDVDGGISSFLHSVDLIENYINAGDELVLLSSGGINIKLISKNDPRVAFLFGDASASLLFGYSNDQHILSSYFYSNHQYYEIAFCLSLMSIVDRTNDLLLRKDFSFVFDTYKMENWKKAEDFYRSATIEVSKNILDESGLSMDDIDLVLVTENNKKLWELTLETLGVNEEKSISLLRNCGNTMSAMLPLLIDEGIRCGKIEEGMNVMLISHGEGISGGGIIYKF